MNQLSPGKTNDNLKSNMYTPWFDEEPLEYHSPYKPNMNISSSNVNSSIRSYHEICDPVIDELVEENDGWLQDKFCYFNGDPEDCLESIVDYGKVVSK